MKKLILILITFTLFGCEKYELPSNPRLNLNGRWDVVKVKVVIDKVNYGSDVKILSDDEAAVSNFYVSRVNGDGTLILTQNFNETSIDKRFNIDKTNWEFDYNKLMIFEDGKNVTKGGYIFTTLPCTYCTKQTVLEWDYLGSKTRYTFDIDTYGAMPSNELILTSQQFVTNIMLNGNTYDKAVISHLEITFHKL